MQKIEKWQIIVLVTAFIQLISPGIVAALGLSVGSEASDPQITPAGYTFVVWGVITLLAFSYGVYQILPNRKNRELHYKMSKGLSIVYILFAAWLVAAILDWLFMTVGIFICMFFILTFLFQKLIKEKNTLSSIERIILFGQVAVYTGWTTVAIFANTASALKFYGLSDTGASGIIWQALILVFALMNSKYWLQKFNTNLIFGITILWALIGIFFGLTQYDNNVPLLVLVVFGVFLVIAHLFADIFSKNKKAHYHS
jgi:hypothetical protein